MDSKNRWRSRIPVAGPPTRMISAGLVLLALLATTSALTVRAMIADRSARRNADRNMDHLASMAAWELARQISANLDGKVRMAMWPVMQLDGQAARPGDIGMVRNTALPPADLAFSAAHAMQCNCSAPFDLIGFVQVPLDTTVPWSTRLSGSGWIANDVRTVDSIARTLAQAPRAGRSRRTMMMMMRSGSGPTVVVLRASGRLAPRVLLGQVVRDPNGAPVAFYGALASAASVDSVFGRIVADAALLPQAVTAGISKDSLLESSVVAPDGAPIYRSHSRAAPSAFVGKDSIGDPAPSLAAQVRLLEPALALAGDSGPSRIAVPILLFIVTVALGGLGAWELWRHARLDQLRTDFLASVSHEFQTPLALITAYAQSATNGCASDERERQRFMSVIVREAQRLGRLVENVLRVTLAGRSPAMVRQPMLLTDIVARACDDFAPIAAARSCRVDVLNEESLTVLADDGAIRQVLFNILDNAVRYGGAGQVIRVAIGRDGATAAITIDDQGPGIPRADRARVFQRFVRLTTALGPDAAAGSGIGLSVVRDIMREHGGTVTIDDVRGRGTRVRLTLPLLVPAVAPAQSDLPVQAEAGTNASFPA